MSSFKFTRALALVSAVCLSSMSSAEQQSTVILEDHFQREEANPEKEQVGGGWGTNSKSRAKGEKQVDLEQGAMHVVRAEVADHGVSVYHDLEFQDATISLRFKLRPGDDLGVNLADMKEKSVHAGHLCVTRIRAKKASSGSKTVAGTVEMVDLKTGAMELETRTRRKAGMATEEDTRRVASKVKRVAVKIQPDHWHALEVSIRGPEMSVRIDGKAIGSFSSDGIAHPTKRRLRLAVNKQAWIDDVIVKREK